MWKFVQRAKGIPIKYKRLHNTAQYRLQSLEIETVNALKHDSYNYEIMIPEL